MFDLLTAIKEITLEEVYKNWEKKPEFIRPQFYKYCEILKSLDYKIL